MTEALTLPPAEQVAEALTPGTFLHDVAARLYRDKALLDNGCWGWSGSVSTNGYARVLVPLHRGGAQVPAHRLSYVIHHGAIPAGMHVLHSCDNPLCTNPLHLRAGTERENAQDRMDRGAAAKKVRPEQIEELAGRVARGELSGPAAGREAGVASNTVYQWIKVRRRRGLLPPAGRGA